MSLNADFTIYPDLSFRKLVYYGVQSEIQPTNETSDLTRLVATRYPVPIQSKNMTIRVSYDMNV